MESGQRFDQDISSEKPEAAPSEQVAAGAVPSLTATPQIAPSGAPPLRVRSAQRRSLRSLLADFLLLRTRLAEAERQAHGDSASSREALQRSAAARDAARGVLPPGRRRPTQADLASACILLRDSTYWAIVALVAREPGSDPPEPCASPGQAWAALEGLGEASGLTALSEHERRQLRRAFVERTEFEVRGLPPAEQATDLAALQRGLDALLGPLVHDVKQVARLRMIRRLRWLGMAAVLLSATAVGAEVYSRATLGPNLALGKAVSASSQKGSVGDLAHVVDGKTDEVGGQTLLEQRPWVRIDLRSAHTIRQVVVVSAKEERTAPVVVTVSKDGKKYEEVARAREPFASWRATFEPIEARFVKVRATQKTLLRLSEIEVR